MKRIKIIVLTENKTTPSTDAYQNAYTTERAFALSTTIGELVGYAEKFAQHQANFYGAPYQVKIKHIEFHVGGMQ